MNSIVKMSPVITIQDWEKLILEKLGYENMDEFYEVKDLDSKTITKIRDHIGWDYTNISGNYTYHEVWAWDKFVGDHEEGGYFELTKEQADLLNRVDDIIQKMIEDGEIPGEFILLVSW